LLTACCSLHSHSHLLSRNLSFCLASVVQFCRLLVCCLCVLGCVSAKVIYCYKYLLVSFLSTFSFHTARLVALNFCHVCFGSVVHFCSVVLCLLFSCPPLPIASLLVSFSLSCCCILFSVNFIESCCPTSTWFLLHHLLRFFSSFVPSSTVFTLPLCELVLYSDSDSAATATTEFSSLLLAVSVTGYIFVILLPLPPLPHHAPRGNHFALTEQITNFVIFSFISFHSVCICFLPKGRFLKQPNFCIVVVVIVVICVVSVLLLFCGSRFCFQIWFPRYILSFFAFGWFIHFSVLFCCLLVFSSMSVCVCM